MLIDHVIYATPSAATTAERLRADHGVGATEGAFHPEHGTHNWVVPLGPTQYVELLEIVDRGAAGRSPIGQLMLAKLAADEGLASWAILTTDLDAVAARVGIAPGAGKATDQAGKVIGSWRFVAAHPDLPFFIAYDSDDGQQRASHERRFAAAKHDAEPTDFAWIEVGGDSDRLRSWIGDDALPIRFVGGRPGPRRVAINTVRGEVVLGAVA